MVNKKAAENSIPLEIVKSRKMEFEEYLLQKKIDAHVFQRTEPARYAEWKNEFVQLHPASFTAQKKFLLNDTRRKYLVR